MGKLVAVEGPDYVGKTTLVQHLTLELKERGFSVANFRFPPHERSREVDILYDMFTRSGDPMAQQLALVKIFNAYMPKILNALRENDLVVIDRYMLSVLVACKALDLDLKEIQQAMRAAIVPPDVTIIYTGEPFVQPEDLTEAAEEFRDRVRKEFEDVPDEYRYPTVVVTNEAARHGHFKVFVEHLGDQVLGLLGRPLKKETA
ncbi:MAG: AAA family ATPase [Euryarchaeota archaeon]|nr:AAA family ATPase [Euryarchaeota archaeon]